MKDTGSEVKVLLAYHKPAIIFKNDCLEPMQVGRICADEELDMIGDDTGDNISHKNFAYAELTAIYWLWKNSNAKYKGLLHYRRVLDLDPNSLFNEKEAYEVPLSENFSADNFIEKMHLNANRIKEILKDNTIITRRREDLRSWSNHTVESHYKNEHVGEHLDMAMEIIKNDYPDFYPTAVKLIKGHTSYYTNTIIMKDKDFDEYASWMFGVLGKLDEKINLYHRRVSPNTPRARYAGYLGERLTAIYITKTIKEGKKVAEFPSVVLVPPGGKKWHECNTYDKTLYHNKQPQKTIIHNSLDKTKPKVSVIMAAYNVESYVEKALNSVINQTLDNIEIIIVNDGSTDNTPALLKKFADSDSRIIIINKQNQGLGFARNTGIKAAQGEYAHLMDSDDYMDEFFLESMVKQADKNKSEIVVSTFKSFDDNGIRAYSTLPHTLIGGEMNVSTHPDLLLVPCHVWDKLYRLDFIKDIPFLKEGGEDIYFWWRIILKADRISALREIRYNYRYNDSSVQTKPEYAISVFTNAVKSQELVDTQPRIVQEYFQIFKYILIHHMLRRAECTLRTNKQFRKDFYQHSTSFLAKEIKLSPQMKLKCDYFYVDYAKMHRLCKVKSFKKWEVITGFKESSALKSGSKLINKLIKLKKFITK